MKKLSALFAAALILVLSVLPVFADSEDPFEETMSTVAFTVLDSNFDAENNRHEMIVSNRMYACSKADRVCNWYYTTCETGFNLDDPEVTLSSDGSETGDAILEAVKRGEPVPAGTVVKLTWNGLVAESYPPMLGKIFGFEFTGDTTEYTLDDMNAELANLRSMGWGWHDEVSSETNCAVKADFTVAYCDSSTVKDGKYLRSGATLYLVKNDDPQTFVRLVADADKFPLRGIYNEAEDRNPCADFIDTGLLPIGTVVSISWPGMILDTYPSELEGVFDFVITNDKTNLSNATLTEKMNNYFDEFGIDKLIEPVTSAEEPEPNPETGVAMPAVALGGILLWGASVVLCRKGR